MIKRVRWIHRELTVLVTVGAVILAVVLAGWLHAPAHGAGSATQGSEKASERGPKAIEQSSKVALEVISLLKDHYISDVDVAELMRVYSEKQSIADMLAALKDPYSKYMDKNAYAAMLDDMKGTFEGIGITIGVRDGQLTVISPLKGTPGERAGLRPLDRVKSIDGRPTKDMALEYAVSLIKGKKGTEVVLGIERDENGATRAFEVRIVRDTIRVPHVASKLMDGGIGHLQISSFFGDDTLDAMTNEIDNLTRQGMRALILDLRFNPGGSLPLAIQVASKFLPAGSPVVHIVSKGGNRVTYYSGPGKKVGVPVVVLVNEASASSSEIVAGALKDMKAATIVGVTTFGKGLVQTIYPLSDGSAISITTHKYLTAGGNSIDKKGVVPDVVVALPEKSEGEPRDVQLDRAIEILKAKIQQREVIGLAG
ncbi:MAG: S41 family peptidase [Bacillota bacterium]